MFDNVQVPSLVESRIDDSHWHLCEYLEANVKDNKVTALKSSMGCQFT